MHGGSFEGDPAITGQARMSAAKSRGWKVAGVLGVLTIVEYLIAVSLDHPLIPLLPFFAAKGWLILEYFMHFTSFLTGEEH